MTPPLTNDDAINRRLSSLGEYSWRGGKHPELRWAAPRETPSAFRDFELVFYFVSENPDPSAYGRVLDELERLSRNSELLIRDAERCAVDLFREVYADQMSTAELEEYRDESGKFAGERIVAAMKPNAIVLVADPEGITAVISYHCGWDEEHGIELQVDGESIARPWRDGDL